MKRFFYLSHILLMFFTGSAAEFHVDKSQDNSVKFISDAPIEDFEGVTDNIDGYIYWKSLEDLSDNQLYFEVDLTTIDTGINLRNRHMRDNYLETEKYRFTFFEGRIEEINKVSENEYDVTVAGKMFIHGVTSDFNTSGKIFIDGNDVNVQTNFIVALSDYKIDVPQVMFMKIDEKMQLELDFHLEKQTE